MNLDQLTLQPVLSGLSWLLYLLIFGSVAVRAAKRPTRAHLDMVLFFGVTAALILFSAVLDLLNVPGVGFAASLSGALIMALPYTLLRLVQDFADVPAWLDRSAAAGLVLSVAALFGLQASLPLGITLLMVLYFVSLATFNAIAFGREARRTSGVTRRRMQSAAAGTLCLGLVILFAGLSAAQPNLNSLWSFAATLAGMASGLAYFVAFAPPTWLRRAWQEPELRAFLGRVAELPRLPDLVAIQTAIEAGAASAVGGRSAVVGIWDQAAQRLRLVVGGQTFAMQAGEGVVGRAFRDQQAQMVSTRTRSALNDSPILQATRMEAMLIAPITTGGRRLGVLAVLASREPVFTNSDLELVQLLADQAAAVLESRALIDQAAALRVRERSEQNFRLLADTLPQIVWTARPDGETDYVNQRLGEFAGLGSVDLLGVDWATILHDDDRAETQHRWAQACQSGELFEMEYRLRRADGVYRWHLARALPVREDHGSGEITRWFGTATDIDDQKQAIQQAEAAVRARDEFLSIASHELRTPVAGIKGAAQMLLRAGQRGSLEENRLIRTLEGIDVASDRLSVMIGDLLDVSRLQTGRLTIRPRPADLAELVDQCVDHFRERDGGQHLVTVQVAPESHALAVVDTVRIDQVVSNLLENAAKYSPDGGEINVTMRNEAGWIELAVADHGIGVPPESADSLFKPFGRTRTAVDRQIPGLGLGLYICRQIMTLHGGTIWAESPGEGLGTTLRLRLPREPMPPLPPLVPPDVDGMDGVHTPDREQGHLNAGASPSL